MSKFTDYAKKAVASGLSAVVLAYNAGCASMFNSARQEIEVTSTPSEARVFYGQCEVGKTPMKLKADRTKNQSVRVEYDGYESNTHLLMSQINPVSLLNIFFLLGAPIAFAIDASSGTLYRLAPGKINTVLVKEDPAKKRELLAKEQERLANARQEQLETMFQEKVKGVEGLLEKLSRLENLKQIGALTGEDYTNTYRTIIKEW